MWSVLLWKKKKKGKRISIASKDRAIAGMHYSRFRSWEERRLFAHHALGRVRARSSRFARQRRERRGECLFIILIRDNNLKERLFAFLFTLGLLHSASLRGTFVTSNDPCLIWPWPQFFSLSQTRRMSWNTKLLQQTDERRFQPALNRLSASLAREHIWSQRMRFA